MLIIDLLRVSYDGLDKDGTQNHLYSDGDNDAICVVIKVNNKVDQFDKTLNQYDIG